MDGKKIEQEILEITEELIKDYKSDRAIDKMDTFHQPNKDAIIDITKKLLRIVYPGYYRDHVYKVYNVETNLNTLMEDVVYNLNKQISLILCYSEEYCSCGDDVCSAKAEELSLAFLKTIPSIRALLDTDLAAAYDGDPAATSIDEIIFAYPGIMAITIYRLAHELHLLGVPIIPRIMTEYAHSKTGIDIHPGATIGEYFFIDHGTGIVIGETTIIGDNVKIYQGVTLGALSTRGGQNLRGTRRHPTIEDNVTIYANASVLGGDTVIGHDSIIGGSTFITDSVPPDSTIYYDVPQ
ncbi:MAG: serine acetyltransferase [Pseudobutyrivibrio sp.]|nr:serine acetyltransferase [Pseudobutyrivibrio sp.]